MYELISEAFTGNETNTGTAAQVWSVELPNSVISTSECLLPSVQSS